jgi:S-formylglutathione hydrolase FrmB
MAFCELSYSSHALDRSACAWAIVPEGPGPFSVLYLLHGGGDDHTGWCRRTSLERYAEKWPSLMIVMPDSGYTFLCDPVDGSDKYQSALIDDLIPFIDRVFKTREERAGRAIGGLSMGGYGAIKIALQFPELFASAHSHSGSFDFGHGWDAKEKYAIRILGDKAEGGGPNDVYRLAVECKNLPALWIDCGTEDYILDQSRSYHAHLEKSGVPHEYHEFPAGHGWDYWDIHIQDALAFHGRALKLTPR